MAAQFTAKADDLSSVVGFLMALNLATEENDNVRITGSFTIQLPDDGSMIEASWDDASGQYVLSDRVGG